MVDADSVTLNSGTVTQLRRAAVCFVVVVFFSFVFTRKLRLLKYL